MAKMVLLVEMRPEEGCLDHLVSGIRAMQQDEPRRSSCLSSSLSVSAELDQLMIYEVWESEDAFNRYLDWRIEQGNLLKLNDFLIEESLMRTFSFLEPASL